jgi:glycosyltransferase involved in cell wall biosynthesis
VHIGLGGERETGFPPTEVAAFGLPADRIEVLSLFPKIAPELTPFKSEAPILYVGRLSTEKGVADLICAMQMLPSVPLRIAGDGPQRTELEVLARALALTNVGFLGQVQDGELDRLISESQFTVLPSRA